MNITHELPAHAGAIEDLLDRSFGAKRHSKTVYRLRGGIAPLASLCFVALDPESAAEPADAAGAGGEPGLATDGRLVASIRYWPILAGGRPALLLGPIAVDAAYRDRGLGGTLIRYSLDRAREQGHRIVLLVGDAPYYQRFGFTRDNTLGLTLPGPVDLDRFLGLELADAALDGVFGPVERADGSPLPLDPEAVPATGFAAPCFATPGFATLSPPLLDHRKLPRR